MRNKTFVLTTLLLIAGLTLVVVPSKAQQKTGPDDDQQIVNATANKVSPAKNIQFNKELALPFDSLRTLGARIDAARRSHDPVSLAHAASELSVAEKVSGKKAELTSVQLIKQAAELAKLRGEVAELKAVHQIAEQTAADNELVAEMRSTLRESEIATKKETVFLRSNMPLPDSSRTVVVHNNTPQNFDIWVNGYMKTTVDAGQSKWFVVEHKYNPTVIEAFGYADDNNWGPVHLWGKFKTYTVNLN
jgi:hypothetical protein